jgi:uncharacterized protein DUF3536
VDNSSWSCVHGIERWRADCGCSTGGRPGWNQQWRAPLRQSLDWLRDELRPHFEQKAATLLKDPSAARNDYIDVVLDRTLENQDRFFAKHARPPSTPGTNAAGNGSPSPSLPAENKVTILKLMELQRHAMLMYTSCGWFFDELSGIETVQVIMYAARAVQLAQELFGDHIEQGFLEKLAEARSNLPEHGTGADIYRKWVKPAAIDLLKVGAHYIISSLFDPYGQHSSVYCYTVDRDDYRVFESGRARLAVGNGRVCSRITQECANLTFGALHLGDHNVNAGTRYFRGQEDYDGLVKEVSEAFLSGDVPTTLRVLDRQFVGVTYSLKSLFRDEQRRIVSTILDSTLAEAEGSFRQLYERHAPLMRFLGELGTQPPPVLQLTAEFVLNGSLRRAFEEEDLDLDRIRTLLEAAQREHVNLDGAGLSYALRASLDLMMQSFQAEPAAQERLEKMEAVIGMVRRLPFEVNLWRIQNIYYQMLRQVRPEFQARGDEEARTWLAHFDSLGEKLGICVPEPQSPTPSETPVPTAV